MRRPGALVIILLYLCGQSMLPPTPSSSSLNAITLPPPPQGPRTFIGASIDYINYGYIRSWIVYSARLLLYNNTVLHCLPWLDHSGWWHSEDSSPVQLQPDLCQRAWFQPQEVRQQPQHSICLICLLQGRLDVWTSVVIPLGILLVTS